MIDRQYVDQLSATAKRVQALATSRIRFADVDIDIGPDWDMLMAMDGVSVRDVCVKSDELTALVWELEGTGDFMEHSHEQTETMHVLWGNMTICMEGAEFELKPGDSLTIPSGVSHAGYIDGYALVAATYVPPLPRPL